MHKVFQVDGGFQIFWCPSHPQHYTDKVPANDRIYRQKQAAYRRCKQLNEEREGTQMRWTARNLEKTLEQYLQSEDFKQGVIDSTKASWGGSCYKVEILPDGKWQNLWANQIGNRYETPGVIIALPALNCDDMGEFTESGGTEEEYLSLGFDNERDEIETEVRDALKVQS